MSKERELIAGALGKGPDCLGPNELEELAAGRGSDREKEHMSSCLHCTAEVVLLKSFEEAQPSASEAEIILQMERKLRAAPAWRGAEKSSARKWWAGRPVWGFALAGLAALLAIGVFVQQPSTRPLDRQEEDVVRSGKITGLVPLGDLAQAPDTLRWLPVPGAASYEVQLIDIEETVLWQAASQQAMLPISSDVQSLMTERKRLRWLVRARNAQGLIIAASEPEPFRVVAK